MKILLLIIFASLAFNSAFATNNTCHFKQFCPGCPISPVDLNNNFNEVKECTNGGGGSGDYKGCMEWTATEDKNSQNYFMPILVGGQALNDAGDDAKLYMKNLGSTDVTVHIGFYHQNGALLGKVNNIQLTKADFNNNNGGNIKIYSFNDLFTAANITPASAAYIVINDGNNLALAIHAHACIPSSSS